MTTITKVGGRTIELFIPFEFQGRKIDAITFGPFRLGHVLGWNEGKWNNMMELMAELSGLEESVLRELRYPDADRVIESFMALLTPELRADISAGRIPTKPEGEEPNPNLAAATNGVGNAELQALAENVAQQQGPGVPLPTAFDMSEEP